MPTVFTVVLQAVFLLLLASASEAVEWGRTQFKYSPKAVYYVDLAGKRLVIFHGPMKDCDMVGDKRTISRVGLNRTLEVVSPKQMSQLVQKCQRIHQGLFARDPEAYFQTEKQQWDRSASVSRNNELSNELVKPDSSLSLWSLNIFNRVLIFPGTKWCGQGDIAEQYGVSQTYFSKFLFDSRVPYITGYLF